MPQSPELAEAAAAIKLFVNTPLRYPVWAPRDGAWDLDNTNRLTSMRIPVIPGTISGDPQPDFVLDGIGHLGELDPSFLSRTTALAADDAHM